MDLFSYTDESLLAALGRHAQHIGLELDPRYRTDHEAPAELLVSEDQFQKILDELYRRDVIERLT